MKGDKETINPFLPDLEAMKTGQLFNNRYTIEKKLGEGRLGRVFLAQDSLHNNRRVALKIVQDPSSPPEELSAEFFTLSQLNHPNIARVYDFGAPEGGDFYFTSEFIDGPDLCSFQKIYRDGDILLDILVQICRGLEYIHSRGYIHYDIKPGNILVTSRDGGWMVKILDFSLAGKADNLVRGTLEYVAPEVVKGLTADLRADFFSLGVTLHQALTGKLPHSKVGKLDILQSHLQNEQTPIGGTLSPAWQAILVKLLDTEPQRRFQSGNEIIRAINQIFETHFEVETDSTKKSYILSGQWTGREEELTLLKMMAQDVFPDLDGAIHFQSLEEEILFSRKREKIRKKRVCLISGKGGIGKSRLLKEFKYFLQMHRVPLLFGTCKDYWEKAYGPFQDILQQAAILFPPLAGEARALLDQLNGDGKSAKEEEVPGERLKFLEGMVQFFLSLAREEPYVIFLEDLHLADEGTEALFEYLTRNIYISPRQLNCDEIISPSPFQSSLLLFATYKGEGISDFLKGLSIEKETFELSLTPLGKLEIQSLLQSMFSWKKVPPLLLDFVWEASEGNPLYVEELLLSLVEEEILQPSARGWKFQKTLPQNFQSLQDILNRRLDKLSHRERMFLERLSVFHRPLSLPLAREISGFKEGEVSSLIPSLFRKKILKQVMGNGGFRFVLSHPYYQNLLYQELSPEQKVAFHKKAARGLIQFRSLLLEISLEEIVYHLKLGQYKKKLVQYALLAGYKNRDLHAHDRAIHYFQLALSQLTKGSKKAETVTWDLAKIFELKGTFAQAIPLFEDLARSARKAMAIQATKALSRLLIHNKQFQRAEEVVFPLLESPLLKKSDKLELQNSLATLYITRGELDKGMALCRELEPGLKKGEIAQRAILFNNWGVAFLLQNEYKKAQKHFLKSLELWKENHNPYQSSKILVNIGNCSLYLGELREGAKYYKEALQILMETGDLFHTANCLNNLGALYLWGGRFKKSLTYHLESYRIRRKIGASQGIAMSVCNLGKAFSGLGKYKESLVLLQESLRRFDELEDGEGKIVSRLCLGEIYTFLGDLAKAGEFLDQCEEISREFKNDYYRARILDQQGRLALLHGKNSNAQDLFQEAFKLLALLKVRKERNMCLLDLVDLKINFQRERAEGRKLLESLDLLPKEIFKDMVVRYHLLLGQLKREEGDLKGALSTLEYAISVAVDMGDPSMELEASYSLGYVYHLMGKYATAGKYYIKAMEKTREIYMDLPQGQKEIFLRDSRRQKIKDDMYRLKEEAENKEMEILDNLAQEGRESPRLFQNHSYKSLTAKDMDRIYLNPVHFRRIWEEHSLLLKFQEINHHINSDLPISHLLPHIIGAALEMTGAEWGYLIRKKRGELKIEVAWPLEKKIPLQGFPSPVIRESFQKGKSLLVNAHKGKSSILAVPLRIRNHIIGLIYMEKEGPDSFRPRHLDILETFGNQAAISIENAFLVEKTEKIRKLLQEKRGDKTEE